MIGGKDLARARKAVGLSQTALARKAGIGRHAVSYWKCKPKMNRRGWAVARLAEAEPMIAALLSAPDGHAVQYAQARGRGLTTYEQTQARIDAEVELLVLAWRQHEALRAAPRRIPCKAKTRKGTPCRNNSEPGKKRCRFHGGKSTGPKTVEGRERIAETQRQRWAKWRKRTLSD